MLASDEHAAAIAAFNRQIWGDGASAEGVLAFRRRSAADNVVAPGQPSPSVIVVEGSRVIAACGSIPQRLWDGVGEHPAYWVKGLMVLPEYRGGPIGYLVLKELLSHLVAATGRVTALAAAPAARRLFTALGCADLGAVPNFLRPLRPARIARRLDVAAIGLGLPRAVAMGVRVAQRSLRRRGAAGQATTYSREAPGRDELDALWRGARGALAASQVRDGLYLLWRFGPEGGMEPDGSPYGFVTARDAGHLVGVVALRRPKAVSDPRLRGIRVATISDIAFPPERADIGLALLGGVERAARNAGADGILCSTGHRALVPLLRRQAYVPLPGNMHFFLRDVTDTAPRWPRDLASWWLARGDDKEDGVL